MPLYQYIAEVKVQLLSKQYSNIFQHQEKSLQLMLQIHLLTLSVQLNPPIDQYPKYTKTHFSQKLNKFTLLNSISIDASFGNNFSSPAYKDILPNKSGELCRMFVWRRQATRI
jgi:hypothetical protein